MALSDNLVSYWRFNESSGNAVDDVGSNDLTNTGCTYSTGKISNGVDLEASDSDYLSITDASQTGLDFSTDLTFSAWVKFETVGAGVQTICSKYTAGADRSYIFRIVDSSSVVLNILNGASADEHSFTYGPGFSTSTWYHIVVTLEIQTHTLSKVVAKAYVNGDLLDMVFGTITAGAQNGAADFIVGQYNSANYLDGMIDELGAWSRPLTQVEVLQLYNLGSGLTEPFTSPLGIYTDAQAGVEFDAFSECEVSGTNTGVDPFNHTCTDASILLVWVVNDLGHAVTGVTYNSTSLTQQYTATVGNSTVWLGYLLNPPSGSNSLDVTWAGSPVTIWRTGAISFKNVDTTNPFGTTYSLTDNTNDDSVVFKKMFSITAERGMVVDFFGNRRVIETHTEDSQTDRMYNTGNWSGAFEHVAIISTKPHWGFDTGLMLVECNATGTSGLPASRMYYALELNYGGFIAQNGMIM